MRARMPTAEECASAKAAFLEASRRKETLPSRAARKTAGRNANFLYCFCRGYSYSLMRTAAARAFDPPRELFGLDWAP